MKEKLNMKIEVTILKCSIYLKIGQCLCYIKFFSNSVELSLEKNEVHICYLEDIKKNMGKLKRLETPSEADLAKAGPWETLLLNGSYL